MLRVLADFLMIIICFILQNTVFQALALASISPNLLVILTSSMGLMRGKKEGMLVGFFCGFLVDTVVNIALSIENFEHLRDAFHMFHLIILIHGQFNCRKFDRPFVFSYDHRMKFVVADFIKKPCNVV